MHRGRLPALKRQAQKLSNPSNIKHLPISLILTCAHVASTHTPISSPKICVISGDVTKSPSVWRNNWERRRRARGNVNGWRGTKEDGGRKETNKATFPKDFSFLVVAVLRMPHAQHHVFRDRDRPARKDSAAKLFEQRGFRRLFHLLSRTSRRLLRGASGSKEPGSVDSNYLRGEENGDVQKVACELGSGAPVKGFRGKITLKSWSFSPALFERFLN
jgi:hypothetical protein